MATRDDVIQAIRNADAAGDSDSVRKLGAYLQTMSTGAPAAAPAPAPDPTEGMSTFDKFAAGAGKAFTDIGRGAGQLVRNVVPDKVADAVGLPTQADIDDAKRRDAPLMRTGAGVVGNVTGNIAAALPAMFVPGAATLPGAAAIGAVQGLAQPVATGDSRLANTAIGGAAGGGGVALGRLAVGLGQAGKALVEPFTPGGPSKIAARALPRFGIQPEDLEGLTNAPTVTGAQPMLAEQIVRPEAAAGAAKLADTVRLDPQIAGRFDAREVANNAARLNTLQDVSGQGGARDFAQAMRDGTATELYGKAFATKMAPDAAQSDEVAKLLQVPAIRDAMASAREIAANKGVDIGDPAGSIQGLHLTKLAMDDAISSTGSSALQANKASSIQAAQKRLVAFIEQQAPDYADARTTYAAMSRPVNQADVGAELLKRATNGSTDLSGNLRLMPGQASTAMQNQGALIRKATGRDNLGATLADLLDPDQLAKVQGVTGELSRLAAVGRSANGPGSATAGRLSSQNVLHQFLGPTGLPSGVTNALAESSLANTLLRPVQFGYKLAEPNVQNALSDIVLNPGNARALAMQGRPATTQQLPASLQALLPYLEQVGRTSAPSAATQRQR